MFFPIDQTLTLDKNKHKQDLRPISHSFSKLPKSQDNKRDLVNVQ